jgi:hypothetical protein
MTKGAAILVAAVFTAVAGEATWLRDITQATQKAKLTGKAMVLVFGQDRGGKSC